MMQKLIFLILPVQHFQTSGMEEELILLIPLQHQVVLLSPAKFWIQWKAIEIFSLDSITTHHQKSL